MDPHSCILLSVDGTVHHNPQEKTLHQSKVNVIRQEDASQSHHNEQEVKSGNVIRQHEKEMAKTDWKYMYPADNKKKLWLERTM